jgi:hypothetical protein
LGRWRTFLVAIGAALAANVEEPRAQQSVSGEDTVKATFLYRFASFVEWPAEAFSAPDAPIRICVAGAEPIRALLQTNVADQRIGGRPFEVRRLSSSLTAPQCHIIYAAGAITEETLRAVRGLPVLTITDSAAGRSERGIIHFVVIDDRVRFHIDDARALEGRLSISSRLLTLAISVRRRA